PPRRVSNEDFEQICETFAFQRGERDALRSRLDGIIDTCAESMRQARLHPDRPEDRHWLKQALKATRKARAVLPPRPGKAAEDPLRIAGAQLAGVVTVAWLAEKFPAFEKLLAPPGSDCDSPEWKPWAPSDDPSAVVRAEFIGRETVPVLSALLGEV